MSTVIVETLTGKIAETDRATGWSMGQRRPHFRMVQICTEMNERAEALRLKTRYELARTCGHCGGKGRQQIDADHWFECGFCENGVVR